MKKNEDSLDQLFRKFQYEWDIEDLEKHHQQRFYTKLKTKNSKKYFTISFVAAASIVLLFGLFMFNKPEEQANDLQFASKETKQTDSIFTVLIKNELIKIKDKKSPENEKIIVDALQQMKALDLDYENIKKELATNGESKQIIYAMISNLQTRISFLQNVLQHIENNKKLKIISDENSI